MSLDFTAVSLYLPWRGFHRAGLLWSNPPKPIGRQAFSWCYKYLFLNIVLTYCYVPSIVLCSVLDFQVQIIKTMWTGKLHYFPQGWHTVSLKLQFWVSTMLHSLQFGEHCLSSPRLMFHSVDPKVLLRTNDAHDVSQSKTRFRLITVCYHDLSWIALPIPDLASLFFLHAPSNGNVLQILPIWAHLPAQHRKAFHPEWLHILLPCPGLMYHFISLHILLHAACTRASHSNSSSHLQSDLLIEILV